MPLPDLEPDVAGGYALDRALYLSARTRTGTHSSATQLPTPALKAWSMIRPLTVPLLFSSRPLNSSSEGWLSTGSNPSKLSGGCESTGSGMRRNLARRRGSRKASSRASPAGSGGVNLRTLAVRIRRSNATHNLQYCRQRQMLCTRLPWVATKARRRLLLRDGSSSGTMWVPDPSTCTSAARPSRSTNLDHSGHAEVHDWEPALARKSNPESRV